MLSALLAAAALAVAGCGDDEGSDEPGAPPSGDEWRQSVDGYCSDAYQEATALPLPTGIDELGPDAAARAEIVGNVRDSIVAQGQPDDIDSDAVGGYVDELNADIEQLSQISEDAAAGNPDAGTNQLDESAGEAASGLGLENCQALAQAIARTP